MKSGDGWQEAIFQVLKRGRVRQVAYVPDAGHAHLIRRAKGVSPTAAPTPTTGGR